MKAFQFKPEKCDLCRKCEEACAAVCGSSKNQSGQYVPHIRVFQGPKGPFMRLCKHCEEAPCVDACIGESLQRGPDGLVLQDEKRCIGCFMCNMVCPHGAIKTVMSQEKAFKCTMLCGKQEIPTCVFACDRGALFFEDMREHNNQTRRARLKEMPRK
jgi:carbon-monoxide dehydrogenase iron sulfur subunit